MEISLRPYGLIKSLRKRLRESWQQHFESWVHRRIPPARNTILNLHNIFIIPNKQGLVFCFVLALMFVGAVNYETSLASLLVFWLVSMFILTIFYTYRNLSGLHISGTANTSVFAGENAEVSVILNRHGERIYESIILGFNDSAQVTATLIDNKEQRASLYLPAVKRGWFSPGRLTIETTFPFGICRSWSLVDLDINCLVYPRPINCDLDWLNANQDQAGNTNIIKGNDDFYNLREYQKGDPLKHVAWKIFARGQGMYTKQYASNMDDKIWLDWDMFTGMNTEERLSRLCYCVLKLDANGLDYGLILPGVRIEPGKGSQHYAKVLRKLALYGLNSEGEQGR